MSDDATNPKPFIVVPPGAISRRDLARLRDAGYLVITSKSPIAQGPQPTISAQDRAAIATAYWLIFNNNDFVKLARQQVRAHFAVELLKFAPLSEKDK